MRKQFILMGLLILVASGVATAGEVAQGRLLYVEYCASCHGANADGKGPLARELITPPSNLRLLSARYGKPLPEDRIARFIDGRADVKAHGTRDMPVWGKQFSAGGTVSESDVRSVIAQLVAYLQSIQTGVTTASGGEPASVGTVQSTRG